MSAVGTQTCYRHPNRETAVSCSSCGRPICPDCMTPTPVGMRCPECSKQRTEVRTARNLTADPTLTFVLIGINVLVFLAEMFTGTGTQVRGELADQFALVGTQIQGGELVGVSQGEWYRLITGGFLHANLIHIGFNMYLLYLLGSMMEPAIGKVRFGALYFASLLGGSLGVMLLDPFEVTVGASGAVFGLIAAGFLVERSQGIGLFQSSLGMLLVLNLVITFIIPNISIGGHIGGMLVGGVCGYVMLVWAPRQSSKQAANIALGATIAIGLAAAAAAIWAADYAVQNGALI
ncbi:MAG: rhomboid family intramembrane serine protease [Baekduiaceae bacterium]